MSVQGKHGADLATTLETRPAGARRRAARCTPSARVLPNVALDRDETAALDWIMERDRSSIAGAVRAALLSYAVRVVK